MPVGDLGPGLSPHGSRFLVLTQFSLNWLNEGGWAAAGAATGSSTGAPLTPHLTETLSPGRARAGVFSFLPASAKGPVSWWEVETEGIEWVLGSPASRTLFLAP